MRELNPAPAAEPVFEVEKLGLRSDRSVVPRKPRSRSQKKPGQPAIGSRAVFVTRELRPLSIDQVRETCSAIRMAPFKSALLRAGIQDIASSYLRHRQQPEPLKAEARHDLAMIAHKVWRLERYPLEAAATKAELRCAIGKLNDLAQSALWGGLDRHPAYNGPNFYDYLRRVDLDWAVIADAADTGRGLLPGGDYPNIPAGIAIQNLVALYEDVTGIKATFSLKPVGPAGKNDRRREIGNSPCFRFLAAFFREVDPAVTPLWITGKWKAIRQKRRNTMR